MGIIARSVEDAALTLGVLAGHDDAALSATAPTMDYLAAMKQGGRPAQLGIPKDFTEIRPTPR